MDTDRLIKSLTDAIPAGPHPEPHTEWVLVRLDFVQASVDVVDWLETGLNEWRSEALTKSQHLVAVQATARVAIHHLQTVLNKCRTADEQQRADTAARDWLTSISSEPN